MPGADLVGVAGLSDQVDNHYFRIFSSALMFSLFGTADYSVSRKAVIANLLPNKLFMALLVNKWVKQLLSWLLERI